MFSRFLIRHYSARRELHLPARPPRWPLLRAAVAERSMEPALRPGDWLLARRARRVRPGQLVLAWHPGRPGFLLVKRAAWEEPGGWWLASDNPVPGTVDSARFGPVPRDQVAAVVLARYWPRPRLLLRPRPPNGGG